MLFKQAFLSKIESGKVTLAFRRWKRPTVREGGTLLTPVGVLSIKSVTRVTRKEISDAEARRAGYASRQPLLDQLDAFETGDLYRIAFRYAGPDPRIALRKQADLSEKEMDTILGKLHRLDAGSFGRWTFAVLRLIDNNPGVRAGDLAPVLRQQLAVFKQNVRKLKALGLTESLEVGYRLSPRGQSVLRRSNTVDSDDV
jgi:hypothetical protein